MDDRFVGSEVQHAELDRFGTGDSVNDRIHAVAQVRVRPFVGEPFMGGIMAPDRIIGRLDDRVRRVLDRTGFVDVITEKRGMVFVDV